MSVSRAGNASPGVKIALASGKGGAGKTFVSLHLAELLSQEFRDSMISLVDTDVEEPNISVYLSGEILESERAKVLIPEVDNEKCEDCSFYSDICEFHALIPLHGGLLVYEHNCHSCSACWTLSPDGAVTPKEQEIGTISTYKSGGLDVTQGVLDEGSIATVAMIEKTLAYTEHRHPDTPFTLIDAPPGTSCAALAALKDADITIIVAEDTLFGKHDASILIATLEILDKPFVLVINKYRGDDSVMTPYCEEKGYRVLARIPFLRDIAQVYGGGSLVFSAVPQLKEAFTPLVDYVKEELR